MLVKSSKVMDATTTYTPLECLLVFRSLAAIGTDEEDFVRISKLLNKSPLVRNCPSYDPKRLEVSALRRLYFEQLQDKPRVEEEDNQEQINQPLSRKRSVNSSKTSPNNDCNQYKHKLPLLVEKLYARYRDYMIKAIAEEERRYIKLQGQIKKIERGEWNGGISDEDGPLEINGKKLPLKKKNGIHLDSSYMNRKPAGESPPQKSLINSKKKADVQSLTSSGASPPSSSKNENTRTLSKPNLGLKKTGLLKLSQPKSDSQNLGDRESGSVKSSTGKDLSSQNFPSSVKSGRPASKVHSEFDKNCFSTSPEMSMKRGPSPAKKNSKGAHSPISSSKKSSSLILDTPADAANKQRLTFSPLSSTVLSKISPKISTPLSNSHMRSPKTKQQDKEKSQHHRSSPQPLLLNHKQRQSLHSQSLQTKNKKSGPSKPTGQTHAPLTPLSQNSIRNIVAHLSNAPGPPSPQPLRSVTGYGTNWNPTPTGSTPRNFTPLPPPEMEPLSPIMKPYKIIIAENPSNKKKKEGTPQAPVTSKKVSSEFSKKTSESSTLGVPPERQIVLSEVSKEQSSDNQKVDSIKQEVTTLNDPEIIDSTGVEQPSNSKLPKTITFPRRATKRKREDYSEGFYRAPSTVLWTRAFPRISAQALQDISTDKNASMFANPIKEKDAPGYRKIILRPQDLKSIRSAITAGHRAALAAAPDDLSPSTTSLWLPISEDLIPPKGIINYAQLEKELMRMFANAIMFNADPRRGLSSSWRESSERNKEEAFGYSFDEDSVVKGTRDMYAAVEKKVSDLRSVERRNEKSWTVKAVKDQNNDQTEDSVTCQENQYGTGEGLAKKRRKI
ncbi:putative wd domain containing protein [Golovinomyces cichoracearum]|uniref:Putative wd domain containing protein n=1 Tax=Golovinomyces cichoracearum TaxID=62708 RepID=A0A420INA8_9PEZI|nr:putative wd domain containing protein [Golovinomyces cichoracearum]